MFGRLEGPCIVLLILFLPLLAALSFAARAAVVDIVLNKKRGERVWGRILGKSQAALWAFRVIQGGVAYAPIVLITCIPWGHIRCNNEEKILYPTALCSIIVFVIERIKWGSTITKLRAPRSDVQRD